MSTLSVTKQLSLPLVAALALGCVLLYLLSRGSPSYVASPSDPMDGATAPRPEAAPSPPARAHVAPRTPELPMASFPERPTRFAPTGDLSHPIAQMLVRFLAEARLTDAQQQQYFGLIWDAKQEWKLLLAQPISPDTPLNLIGVEWPQFLLGADEDINRQMREVLTPEQWELYIHGAGVSSPVVMFDFIGPDPEEE
jgi:hypothetical protein